jgi:tetratricopeptide (TPR) repeat protein
VPWSRAEAIHRQTEGNPLFVQEVLRYLVEEGIVVREDGRYLFTETDAGIPEGLRDVVGKRLSRLSERTNQVLAIAAVIGREFGLDVLQQVAGLEEEELYAALEEATERAVVEERQTVGKVGFRFTHAFFRQTLYEEIFVPRRIRLHQQVGKALEAVYGRRLEEHAAELAEHFVQSTEPGDLEKALRYSELAAQRAMQVFAYSEAVRHLEQALGTLEVLDPDAKTRRCRLLLGKAEAMLPLANPSKIASTVAPEAFQLAESVGDSSLAARAAVLACQGMVRSGLNTPYLTSTNRAEFLEWSSRANMHAPLGTADRVHADIHRGAALVSEGRPADGHVHLRRALDQALDLGDNALVFAAAGAAFTTLRALQDRETVEGLVPEILGRPRNAVRPDDLARCLFWAGRVLLRTGNRESAEEVWRELTDLAERTQDASISVMAMGCPCYLSFLDGRLEEALTLAQAAWTKARELNVLYVDTNPPELIFYLGGMTEKTLDLYDGLGRPAQTVRALVLAYLGRHSEARAIREKFGDLGAQEDATASSILLTLFEAAILGSDADTVRALLPRLAPLAAQLNLGFGSTFSGSIARDLGDASALLDKPDEARVYYQQALEVCANVRFRPEIALTRLHLAELLLEHYPDELAEPQGHLDFAIAEFREMKMRPALERALSHRGLLKA